MHVIKVLIVLTIILLFSHSVFHAQFHCDLTNNPAEVKFSYDDMDNFVFAFDGLDSTPNPVSHFQREYIAKASPGLKEYLREGGFESNDYLAAIKKNPLVLLLLRI